MPDENKCLFCRISSGDLPADVIWEDENSIAFKDIHPKAPVHVLLIPKKHILSLAEAEEEDRELLGALLYNVRVVAEELGITEQGFRTIINTRQHGGQEVDHVHIHILGGEFLGPMRA